MAERSWEEAWDQQMVSSWRGSQPRMVFPGSSLDNVGLAH